METRLLNIAIDGPAGAGKSTIARRVAEQIGYIYVDTGAMYRAMAWKSLQKGIDPQDEAAVSRMAESVEMKLALSDQGQRVVVDGSDITEEIRMPEVSGIVSYIAQIGSVREQLVCVQKRLASDKGVVMDGRDIGTHVLPDAEVKVFLTATVEERARRRYKELTERNVDVSLEQLMIDIEARDRMDEQRAISPLVKAPDAVLLDSTAMTISEVADAIIRLYHQAMEVGQ